MGAPQTTPSVSRLQGPLSSLLLGVQVPPEQE